LVDLRQLEFQFVGSILGILQNFLELLYSIIALDPFFQLLNLALISIGFSFNVVQTSVSQL
jgi:hypothetical protein